MFTSRCVLIYLTGEGNGVLGHRDRIVGMKLFL